MRSPGSSAGLRRLLDLGLNVILPMLVQPIFVSLMYRLGTCPPVYRRGDRRACSGMGIAAYAAELLTFLLGLWLYRRVGYNARILFLAHFDWEVVKTSFRFGVFEMLGSAAWSVGQAAEICDHPGAAGQLRRDLGQLGAGPEFHLCLQCGQHLERRGHARHLGSHLTRAEEAQPVLHRHAVQVGRDRFSAFLGAVLLAVGPRFILGASGSEFERAAVYVVPLMIWGAIQYPSWVGDKVQLGSNKPYLKSVLVFGEQCIRVVLAWILLERFQVAALIIAYFVGLLAKDFAAYFINHKLCFPQRFFFWQSLAVPLMTAAVHYLIMDRVAALLWKGDQLTSILIFFIGVLPSLPVYMFIYGLFGGWDDATLLEFREAGRMTGPVRGIVDWFMVRPTALGARLSPLNNRFPIWIRAEAMEEARQLTEERVKF